MSVFGDGRGDRPNFQRCCVGAVSFRFLFEIIERGFEMQAGLFHSPPLRALHHLCFSDGKGITIRHGILRFDNDNFFVRGEC